MKLCIVGQQLNAQTESPWSESEDGLVSWIRVPSLARYRTLIGPLPRNWMR